MFKNFYCFLLLFLFSYCAFAQNKDSVFICGANEVHPSFPGGFAALNKYINSTLHYPDSARNADVSGKVILTFTVKKDGRITDVKILRDLAGYGCAEEARRIVLAMPKWNPGKQNGVPVDVHYTMPVNFKLD